jgi:hypothetical protein
MTKIFTLGHYLTDARGGKLGAIKKPKTWKYWDVSWDSVPQTPVFYMQQPKIFLSKPSFEEIHKKRRFDFMQD